MKISVTYLDGRKADPQVIPFDTVKLERKFDISIEQLEQSGKVEHVMFLAWTALTRLGLAGDDFDTWAATVEDIGSNEDEEDESGNGGAASAAADQPGPSNSSPGSPLEAAAIPTPS